MAERAEMDSKNNDWMISICYLLFHVCSVSISIKRCRCSNPIMSPVALLLSELTEMAAISASQSLAVAGSAAGPHVSLGHCCSQ